MTGVCGMGGVGKTTLVDEVREWAKREGMFNEIVKVVVSKDVDLKKIQSDIAEQLKFNFSEENLEARADRLRGRLSQEGSNGKPKRVLLVLDDLWETLDLKEVGILFGKHHKGCKILLTSRYKNVLDEMEADRIFSLQPFTPEESWSLFKSSLGDTAQEYQIADSIVKECAGLPLAITTIARALRGKEESTWNYVHKQLKESIPLKGYSSKVYTTFQLSYEFIEEEESKRLFLLCSLYPEDAEIPIEELVRYTVGLRILKRPCRLHEEREEVAFYIEKLQNSNLLLIVRGYERKDYVRMHDLVRDFGISISKQSMARFYVDMIKTWPIEERDQNLITSISLQFNEIADVLPSGLRYHNLELLRLTSSELWQCSGLEFSESFFDGMRQLQVLYCSSKIILKLPGSMDLLINLRTLSLVHCKIEFDVSVLGRLQNLEILSFCLSHIKKLPKEIGYLSRLRLLDLTGCDRLERIAPGVLSSLVRLEELYLRCLLFFWSEEKYLVQECELFYNSIKCYKSDDSEEGNSYRIGKPTYHEDNPSIDELNKLPNLVVFDGFLSTETLVTNLPFRQRLNKFRISEKGPYLFEDLGLWINISVIEYNFCNTLEIKDVELDSIFKAMCRRTVNLTLRHMDVSFLADGHGGGGYTHLTVSSCTGMPYLDNFTGISSGQSFMISPSSSSLNQLAPFANLRELMIIACHDVKSMCSVSIARGLKELIFLQLSKCSNMVEVLTEDEVDTDKIYDAPSKIIFPRLKCLILYELEKLVGFCKSIEEIEFPQLQYLELFGLPMITSIYSDKETLPLHNEDAASQNQSLFTKAVNLPSLASLFISDMASMKTKYRIEDLKSGSIP